MRLVACLLAALFLLIPTIAFAQEADPPEPEMTSEVAFTPVAERLQSFMQRRGLLERSLVENVALVNIGPTVMSGRVVDLDVSTNDPTRFYVAYASGGLWRTSNNGLSFEPLFDDQAAMTIGDIAVNWGDGETIWVGTGENNSSRSSYAGVGVYKSGDGGASWQHLGLDETHHIGRIVLHPSDPNTAWVAALGHLYSANEERGVYKTTDGGATWTKTLFVDANTGIIDLVLDPGNPDVLYAAAWHRLRRAWNLVEAGPSSGIYKSTDGGATWTLLTTEGTGFPTGEGVGRIGLAVYPGDANIVYALLDNQHRRPEEEEDEEQPALTKEALQEMSVSEFLAVAEADLEDYLERNGFPAAYTAQSILEMVRRGELEPLDLVAYLEDANQQLFDTPVVGAEVYRSDDGGQTWTRTHEDFLDNLYYSYGYYFGEIRVAPETPERIYLMGVPILKSEDGGQSFASINEPNVHVDHHALWVSPSRPGHLVNGNDGGVNISFDDGATWFKANTPTVGQFYAINVDSADVYNVYGGLQDNGVWVGPHTYEHDFGWYQEGDYPYDRILGGDGMQIEVDTRTNDIVYTGFQFGNYFRINKSTGETSFIKPEHELGERPLRFNWQTPIHLSRHNRDILYLGSNKLHRSLDQGETWETLSDDLTRGGRPGDVPYGTLTSIDESPLRFGLLYVGTDDGLAHVSRDGGFSWRRLSDGLPENLWVSRVEASHHAEGRIYLSLNGYRWDNFSPYLYRSDDYGRTWSRIGQDLPMEPINVVVEDPRNERLLYVGTDHGLYVSLDGGDAFMTMMREMPNVPIHDLKIQTQQNHLLVGTHGRSIYRADVSHVQQLTPELLDEALHVFAVDPLTYDEDWGHRAASWMEFDEVEVTIPYFAGQAGTATIAIKTEAGAVLRTFTDAAERGLNYAAYDLTADAEGARRHVAALRAEADEGEETKDWKVADDEKIYLRPGTYTVAVTLAGETASTTLEIKAPPDRSHRGEPEARPSEAEEIK